MRMLIQNGSLYINNHYTCHARGPHGSSHLQPGTYAVTAQFSHAHGKDLPYAIGLGFLGADDQCDVVLGRVLASNGVTPCASSVAQVMVKIELAEDDGKEILLEVR